MNIKPLDDRVLIQQNDAEETSSGGIVLPDTAKEKPQRGKVVSLGPGRLMDTGNRSPICLKKGDDVYYGKYAGTEVDIADDKFVIVKETDVLGVVDKK
jgi:chaperonin GroES